MPKSKLRKVIKTGNSLAVTIPAQNTKGFNIKEGDWAQIKINHDLATITYYFSGHPRQLSLIGKNKTGKTK